MGAARCTSVELLTPHVSATAIINSGLVAFSDKHTQTAQTSIVKTQTIHQPILLAKRSQWVCVTKVITPDLTSVWSTFGTLDAFRSAFCLDFHFVQNMCSKQHTDSKRGFAGLVYSRFRCGHPGSQSLVVIYLISDGPAALVYLILSASCFPMRIYWKRLGFGLKAEPKQNKNCVEVVPGKGA